MDSSPQVLRFANTAIVLKQPLLVGLFIVFILGLLFAQFGTIGSDTQTPEPTTPLPVWAWFFWAVVAAIGALGVWMVCHSEEITIDPVHRQITQSHKLLNHEVAKNRLIFADFNGVVVSLHIDAEQRGTTSPTGASTVTSARTVYTRRYSLSLRRPERFVTAEGKQYKAPSYPLTLPMADNSDPLVVEAVARKLAGLGGWPAWRQHYALAENDSGRETGHTPAITVMPGKDDPIQLD